MSPAGGVIGNFARLMRAPPRAIQPDEVAPSADAPPERFTEKISDEAGDVYLAPVLETLRAVLARRRSPAQEDSAPAPQQETPDPRTERPS